MQRSDAKPLFIVTAIVEAVTGVGLLAAPAMVLKLLFGLERVSVGTSLVGRIAGAALTAIAIASWMARADAFTPTQRGLLSGLFIYNALVCALFAFAASVMKMSGVLSWPAVALHAGLAIWCLTCLLPDRVEVAKDTAAN